jgi:hypothetical protein
MLEQSRATNIRESSMGRNSPSLSSKARPASKEEKVLNPSTQFDKPAEIPDDAKLSREEKTAALDTWEQDARQLMAASDEGMPGKQEGLRTDDHHRMDEIGRAKTKIGVEPRHKPSH